MHLYRFSSLFIALSFLLAIISRVIDITNELKRYFPRCEQPLIIINAGGFSSDDFLPKTKRPALYANLKNSLNALDQDGVEIIPQTMPPFPWHFGGQRYHNLFLEPEEIFSFCNENHYRICLDISHSMLRPWPPTCILPMRKGLMVRGCKSVRARSNLYRWCRHWRTKYPTPHLSPKYGKGIKTTARGSG